MVNFYIRRWLNKERHHAGAHVIAEVRVRTWKGHDKEKKKYVSVDADLTIADCNRTVTLDFGAYGDSFDRDKKNVRYKVNTLRHSINQFLDAVEQAYDEAEDALIEEN